MKNRIDGIVVKNGNIIRKAVKEMTIVKFLRNLLSKRGNLCGYEVHFWEGGESHTLSAKDFLEFVK